ncbi:MAG: class I SAM-dependent methyltransferase [Armatimonadetes bacterium]|nr:class I SAM-dependent methyltransferase [Armatimonadota bacterium]
MSWKSRVKAVLMPSEQAAPQPKAEQVKTSNLASALSIIPGQPYSPPIGPVTAHLATPIFESELKALTEREGHQALLEADTWQLPDIPDREGYYGERHYEYWLSGLRDYNFLTEAAKRQGIELNENSAVFDWGCSSGRVLRHFAVRNPKTTLYGCDVNKNPVEWMHEHLDPRLQVFHNTYLPSQPMPDNHVDLFYAFSVFTHIDDYEDTYLLEAKRILKPGGVAVFTICSDHTWAMMNNKMVIYNSLIAMKELFPEWDIPECFSRPMPTEKVAFRHQAESNYATNIFHSASYIKKRWGRYFEVVEIAHERHGYQDCVVLRKPK